MKKWPKKIWIWILSGLSVILGSCSDVSCLYGPPKVYGPPEEVYGPPAPKIEVDTTPESDTIVEEI